MKEPVAPVTILGLALVALLAPAPCARADCLITDHGATANDETIDTRAIQFAIEACARAGGGRVVVPAGRFVTGTITLRRGIELHLGAGARLVGSPTLADYPPLGLRPDDDHTSGTGEPATAVSGEGHDIRALLVAAEVEDVALTGTGTIDGNGEAFWGEGFLTSGRARPDRPRPRPWLWFRCASRVTIRDVVLVNSPSYSLTLERVDDVLVSGVRIRNHPLSPNSDGIQVQSGRNVRIIGVDIRTGDDAIVLKSSGGPVENVLVSASYLESDDSAFKFGTGSRYPIRRVRLSNSIIGQSRYGIALFMKDGGTFEDFSVDHVDISTASRHATDYPIYIDVDRRSPEVPLGRVRDLVFSNVRIRTRGNLLVQGHPAAPIERLRLDALDVRIEKPVDLATLKGKPRGNVLAQAVPDSVDYSRVNAHLTLAHVRGLRTSEVAVTGEDGREASARTSVALIDVALAEEAGLFGSADGPAASLLVGTWRLVDSYETRVSTQEIIRTRGRSPRGLLVYRADGRMTVQVMDDERRPFPSPLVTQEDKAAAFETYTAYFGRFEARPGESAVVHHIEGSLLPNEVGQSRLRFYALDGDRLTLTTPPFDAHGERRTRVIVWERVQ